MSTDSSSKSHAARARERSARFAVSLTATLPRMPASRTGRCRLDRHIKALALEPTYKEAVGRLCCLKGISTQAAMVLVTEIGDFRRFEHPGKRLAIADQQAGHQDRNPGGPLTIR
ncbi:MAG: hypothetical protein OXH51_08620 [Gemmatimonadetes bacterium]|nr:hypothetical protein [Gemmatimonadota bacterium]